VQYLESEHDLALRQQLFGSWELEWEVSSVVFILADASNGYTDDVVDCDAEGEELLRLSDSSSVPFEQAGLTKPKTMR